LLHCNRCLMLVFLRFWQERLKYFSVCECSTLPTPLRYISEHAYWMLMNRKRVRLLKWCCLLLLVKSESSLIKSVNTLVHCLQKLIFFKSLNCSCHLIGLPLVLKIAAFSSHFVRATIAQNSAELKRCQPRISNTAFIIFRKVYGTVSRRIFALQLEMTPGGPLIL